ncbi:MAG: STAS domain-containing protein [Myxococcales bacterium]|nr:STAS domain-containing protein [Myxococcales bacterium]
MSSSGRGHFLRPRTYGAGTAVVLRLHRELDDAALLEAEDAVLDAISESAASGLVIDLTAVDVIDSLIATKIMQIVRTAHCLGAEVALVGVQPGVAAVMVELDLLLDEALVQPARTVEEGLVCLERVHERHRQPARF